MSGIQFEWRATAPRAAVIHKAVIGARQSLCGVPIASLPCRAPIDPSRPKAKPVNYCRRCRRSWMPYIESETAALVARISRQNATA